MCIIINSFILSTKRAKNGKMVLFQNERTYLIVRCIFIDNLKGGKTFKNVY